MSRLIRILGKVDLYFLCLLLGVVLINLPYWDLDIFPQHDTLFNFQIFYFFYTQYFFHHTIAQWVPYGAYGIPSALFQLGVMTPANYLAAFWGTLTGVHNALFLFKASMLFEQFIFLMGMYLLAKLLIDNKAAVFLVCIASFCSMEWLYQVYWNFRLAELFPFVLYFLILFFERRRSFYFWTAGIIGILWSLGIWFYPTFLFIFLGFVICVVLFASHRGAWRDVFPRSKLDYTVMLGFFVIAASYLVFLKNSFAGIAILHRSSTSSAANSMDMFLHYAGNASFSSMVSWLFLGKPLYTHLGAGRDNTAYVGMATIVFFVWAIGYVRNKYFIAILIGFITLVCLSFGEGIASLIYFFPGMKYFRHVGLVYPLVKTCVALGAGFGLADFLRCPGSLRAKRLLGVLLICLLLLDISGVFHSSLGTYIVQMRLVLYFVAFLVWLGLRSVVMILNKKTNTPASSQFLKSAFAIMLITALCMDVFSYRQSLEGVWPRLSNGLIGTLSSVEVNQMPFMEQRRQQPVGRQGPALLLQKGARNRCTAQYESVFAFAQYDPCTAIPATGLLTVNVKDFLDAKFLNKDERDRVRGCSAPKLRVLDGVTYDVAQNTANSQRAGDVVVKDFDANGISIWTDITKKGGAWLVYADSYYPGWEAYIDGSSTQVQKAFLAFKSVYVPEGKHQVRFEFFNGLTTLLSYFLSFVGLIAGATAFIFLLLTLLGLA